MKLKTFLAFVSPSVLAMILLIAVPLIGVMYLSVYNSYIKTEIVEVTSTVPTFAGMKQTTVEKVPQPVLDEDGNPVKVTEFVGSQNFVSVADPAGLAAAFSKDRSINGDGSAASFGARLRGIYRDLIDIDFWGALEFTLLYAFITTPCILVLGFLVALAVNSVAQWLRGPLIFTSLLPFIITPVVGSLSIYWLFLD
ncbi:MAG: sugar ABC transporter permease, partial [Desulfofustis sp.]|nr:sugar ABC transporter permease [Desulfofustis sp.]